MVPVIMIGRVSERIVFTLLGELRTPRTMGETVREHA